MSALPHMLRMTGDATMCDFCGERTTALTPFRARDFSRRIVIRGRDMIVETCMCHTPMTILPGDEVITQNLYGAWGACRDCATFIRKQDKTGLANRAKLHAQAEFGPPVMPVGFFYGIHEPFWLHREGEG